MRQLCQYIGAFVIFVLGWEAVGFGIKMMNWKSDLAYYGGLLLCGLAILATYKIERIILTVQLKSKGEANEQKPDDVGNKPDHAV